MLMIRNLKTGETESLVRDVRHQHPAWVHEQCETSSESELQVMLDQTDADEYIAAAGKPDCCGIYWRGE